MKEGSVQKFASHCKSGGFFYAIYRGVKYLKWRCMCKKMGVDWTRFGR